MTEEDHDKEYEALANPMPTIIAKSMRDDPNYVKCPRCWHYHGVKENHDHLCDCCCKVLIENFSDHVSVPLIKANQDAQRAKYTVSP